MTQPKSPSKVHALLSLGLVCICLILSALFIWWYAQSISGSSTVKLSADDLAAMQTAGRQLNFQNNGGVPNNNGRNGFLQIAPAAPPPPEPDSIDNGVIRAGHVLVRVQAAKVAGGPPIMIFRQRTWGLIQDKPNFTIARRIVHETALARQLAVTPDQLAALTKLVATPALKSAYLSALPVTDDEMATAVQAWKAYVAAGPANRAAADAVISIVRNIGQAALNRAKANYTAADQQISAILQAQQIAAYHAGKSLAP
jgi:hypothetical protein